MNELKLGTQCQVKQENIYYQTSLLQQQHNSFTPIMFNTNYFYHSNGMFNQEFNLQPNIEYANESFYQYPNYTDSFYGTHSYNNNNMMSTANKKSEDFSMTKTSDSTIAMPFHGMSHYQYYPQLIQQNYFMPQLVANNNCYQDCVEQQLENSDPQPIIKMQKNSSQIRLEGIKRLRTKLKNQTKNIPKNYGKAMINFILSHLDWIQAQFGIQKRQDLITQLKKRKSSINAIVHMKDLWSNSKYAKQFRILSNLFIRKYSYAYIFNSRVSNYSTHIKYKYKLQEALRSPIHFSRIKQY